MFRQLVTRLSVNLPRKPIHPISTIRLRGDDYLNNSHGNVGTIGYIKHTSTSSNYHYHQSSSSKHAHDRLWKAERYLSVGLLGILPAAAMYPSLAMDHAVALSLIVHVHWGLEAIVTDYVRPSIFGKSIPKISIGLVYVLSSLALGGLFLFNHSDVGITQAAGMLAKIE